VKLVAHPQHDGKRVFSPIVVAHMLSDSDHVYRFMEFCGDCRRNLGEFGGAFQLFCQFCGKGIAKASRQVDFKWFNSPNSGIVYEPEFWPMVIDVKQTTIRGGLRTPGQRDSEAVARPGKTGLFLQLRRQDV
jgi:hypothetical protein